MSIYSSVHVSSSNYSSRSTYSFDLIDSCVNCLGSTVTAIALAAFGLVVLGASNIAICAGGAAIVLAFGGYVAINAGITGAGYVLGGLVGMLITAKLMHKAVNLL